MVGRASQDEARDAATLRTDVLAGALATGYLLAELMRVWMPSLVVILGEGAGVGPVGLAVTALATFAAAILAAVLTGTVPPRLLWLVGSAVLLGARLGLLLVDGERAQLIVACTGVAGAGVALVALAAGSIRGDLARLGVLSGAALSMAVLAVLGSVDPTWRDDVLGTLGSVTIVLLAAPALFGATRSLSGGTMAAAWPWATVGPALVLLGVLTGPAGRVAVATGWAPGRVAATTVGLMALVAAGGLIAARSGPLLSGTAGAALVLIGTAASLEPAGPAAVAGQATLAAGLGLCVVSGLRGGATSPRRRGAVTATSLVLLVGLVFSAYAGSLVRLPFGTDAVMLVTAGLLAAAALVATLRGARLGREPATPGLGRLTATVLIAAMALAGTGALRSDTDAGEGRADGTLRVVLANVHYGFDVAGRLRALEVADALAALDADLIALNEVDRGWMITGSPDLLATYAAGTGLVARFGPAADAVWGNALLARQPVLEVERNDLPRGGDPLRRSALTVVVELPDGTPLGIIVTHLSAVDEQGDTRLPQAQSVAAVVARLRERGIPTIVAGDLNARPGDPELAVLEDLGLVRALPEGVGTYPDTRPGVQIDHVLVPSALEVLRARTLATGLSDHRFVVVDLALPTTDGGDTPG